MAAEEQNIQEKPEVETQTPETNGQDTDVVTELQKEKTVVDKKAEQSTPTNKVAEQENEARIDNDEDLNVKQDWFKTRLESSQVSTADLMKYYGKEGFDGFESADKYWDDSDIQNKFINAYGIYAKREFDKMYETSQKEFSLFKLGNFQQHQNSYLMDMLDPDKTNTSVDIRYHNIHKTLQLGDTWSEARRTARQAFKDMGWIRKSYRGLDGKIKHDFIKYSPEALADMDLDEHFGGLAYGDMSRNLGPHASADGIFYDATIDGKIYDDFADDFVDVRNDQVVSRLDIDTGHWSDGLLNNNKLEATGVVDYAKTIARAPINMWYNMMDTGVQAMRVLVAGGYGIADMFGDFDLDNSEAYKTLTTAGIRMKSRVGSTSDRAMEKGFFGSFEATLSTVADIVLQVGLARGLGAVGSKSAVFLNPSLRGGALAAKQQAYSMRTIRGTLTALAAKDSYNEALEAGYSTAEAASISGAMAIALWYATSAAGYISGDYSSKLLRQNLKKIIKTKVNTGLAGVYKGVGATGTKELGKKALKEAQSKKVLVIAKNAVKDALAAVKSVSKKLPSSATVYEARQEGLEEMTEELFQDGVKHAASAYGYLMNDAYEAGKGRYMTIFDDGYFKDVIERYATAGIAGAIGGPIGMIGNSGTHNITPTSTVVDVLMSGNGAELINTLKEMKQAGTLGPTDVSTDFSEKIGTFLPILQGQDQQSLGDMVYNAFVMDVNNINTFMNNGIFGEAKTKMAADGAFKDFVDSNSMTTDFVKLMGSLVDFHARTGISTKIYPEMDGLSEEGLTDALPDIIDDVSKHIAKNNEEIEALKAKATEDKKDDSIDDGKGAKPAPKTTPKEEVDKIDDSGADGEKLSRLQAEVMASEKVTQEDLRLMLTNYRKIRAISNGVAAEHYYLQNEYYEDEVYGAMRNRKSEFKYLKEGALINALMSMRIRHQNDEKAHVHTIMQANNIEKRILALENATPKTAEQLNRIISENGDLLTEKALSHIEKLFQDSDLDPVKEYFDPKSPMFVFKKADGSLDEVAMTKAFLELAQNESANIQYFGENISVENAENLQYALEGGLAEKYFASVSKNMHESGMPIMSFDQQQGDMMLEMGQDLVEGLRTLTGKHVFANAMTSVIPTVYSIRALAKQASFIKETSAFEEAAFQNKGLDVLFRFSSRGSLTNEYLIDKGISEIHGYINSITESGVVTKSDVGTIDEILKQVAEKEAMSNILKGLIQSDVGIMKVSSTLSTLRKNVLDILDFTYDLDEDPETKLERHAYKDYTAMSDHFVDFIFDPIKMEAILAKEEKLRTLEDKEAITKMEQAFGMVSGLVVSDEKVMTVDIDFDTLELFLQTKYGDLTEKQKIIDALAIFSDPTGSLLVPANVFADPKIKGDKNGNVNLILSGITGLRVSKWILKNVKASIEDSNSGSKPLPYIQDKNNEILETASVLRGVVGLDDDLSEYFVRSIGDENIQNYLAGTIGDLKPEQVGALNIKVENALYNFYSGNVDSLMDPEAVSQIKELIDTNLASLRGRFRAMNTTSAEYNKHLRQEAIILGAITTDFTPFYARFKQTIEDSDTSDEDTKIVIAAQEFTAKYAAAYIYSKPFRDLASAQGGHGDTYVKSLYIRGTAGSGKSTATTELGMVLGTDILKQQGHTALSIMPVANNESQIEILKKSVGELAEGVETNTPEALNTLLQKAIVDKDATSLAKLENISTILIDEVTYISAQTKDSLLVSIGHYIEIYNKRKRDTKNELALVIMGDPRQSGKPRLVGGALVNDAIELRNTFSTGYMSFSFRARNSFLTDSITALRNSKSSGTNTSTVTLKKGTKYGTTDGQFYGVNFKNAADKSNSAEFAKVLNDAVLLKDIEANIKKHEGSKKLFKVLIVPESLTEFHALPDSKIKALMAKYPDNFILREYAGVGGSEANYVIAEFPSNPFNLDVEYKLQRYAMELHKGINTLMTRAFDYAIIVNKNEDFIIPRKAIADARIHMDGQVIKPDSSIDTVAKDDVKKHYLKILSDIDSQTIAPKDDGVEPADTDGDSDGKGKGGGGINVNLEAYKNLASRISAAQLVFDEGIFEKATLKGIIKNRAAVGVALALVIDEAIVILEKAAKGEDTDMKSFSDSIGSLDTLLESDVEKEDAAKFRELIESVVSYDDAYKIDIFKQVIAMVKNQGDKVDTLIKEIVADESAEDDSVTFDDRAFVEGYTHGEFLKAFKTELTKDGNVHDAVLEGLELDSNDVINNTQKETDFLAAVDSIVDTISESMVGDLYILEENNADHDVLRDHQFNEVLARIVELHKVDPELPDLDINNSRTELMSIQGHAEKTESITEVDLYIKSVREAIDGKITHPYLGEVGGPIEVLLSDLLQLGNRDSVLKALVNVLENAKIKLKKRLPLNTKELKIKRVTELKKLFNIDDTIVGSDLLNKIISLQISDDGESEQLTDDLKELKLLWVELHVTPKELNNTSTVYGDLYYSRGLDRAETIIDFITNAEKNKGELNLIPVRFEKGIVNDPEYTVLNEHEARDLFNFSNTNKEIPKHIELKAVKTGKHLNVYVIAVDNGKKYAISQFDLSEGEFMTEKKAAFKALIQSAFDAGKGKPSGGGMAITIPIPGVTKDTLRARAGGLVITKDNAKKMSLVDMEEAGMVLADELYFLTSGEMKGSLATFYTFNESINLESEALKDDIIDGDRLQNNLNVISHGPGIGTAVGVGALNVIIKASKLSEILKSNRDFRIGEFNSNLATVVQVMMSEILLDGGPQKAATGNVITLKDLTTEERAELEAMQKDFTDLGKAVDGVLKSQARLDKELEMKQAALSSIEQIKSSHPEVVDLIKNIAIAYRESMSTSNASGKFIYKNSKDRGYIFKMNEFLTSLDATKLSSMDTLFEVSSYPVRLSGQHKTKKTTHMSIIGKEFFEVLKPYIFSTAESYNQPMFALTATGIVNAKTSIEAIIDEVQPAPKIPQEAMRAVEGAAALFIKNLENNFVLKSTVSDASVDTYLSLLEQIKEETAMPLGDTAFLITINKAITMLKNTVAARPSEALPLQQYLEIFKTSDPKVYEIASKIVSEVHLNKNIDADEKSIIFELLEQEFMLDDAMDVETIQDSSFLMAEVSTETREIYNNICKL